MDDLLKYFSGILNTKLQNVLGKYFNEEGKEPSHITIVFKDEQGNRIVPQCYFWFGQIKNDLNLLFEPQTKKEADLCKKFSPLIIHSILDGVELLNKVLEEKTTLSVKIINIEFFKYKNQNGELDLSYLHPKIILS